MNQETPSPSLIKMILIAIPIIVICVFLIIAMNTGDLLWFLPGFEEYPAQITIHCYGRDVLLYPGDAGYQQVVISINQSLTGSKRWDQLSMSDTTHQEYQTSNTMMVLELTYNPSVRIHSAYKFFKNIDTLVIPLDGRHADGKTVFGRLRGHMIAGSLHIASIEPMIAAVQSQGLCQKP